MKVISFDKGNYLRFQIAFACSTYHEVLASAMEIELSSIFALLSVLIESDCEAGVITTKSRRPYHRAKQCAREGKSFSTDSKSCQIRGSLASTNMIIEWRNNRCQKSHQRMKTNTHQKY